MSEATTLTIKLTPKAARNALQGWAADAAGNPYLKASVTAVPEKGKANKALIDMLSKEWRIPKNAFTLLRGDTDRVKLIRIVGYKIPD